MPHRDPGVMFPDNPPLTTCTRRDDVGWFKRNPRFIPRWASRTQLVVKDIRAERLQKITEADAIAEGTPKILWASEMRDDKHSWRGDVYFDVRTKNGHSRHGLECSCHKCPSEYCGCNDGYQLKLQPAQCAFRSLWDDIYTKKPELQWHADPWVWRTEFERKGI